MLFCFLQKNNPRSDKYMSPISTRSEDKAQPTLGLTNNSYFSLSLSASLHCFFTPLSSPKILVAATQEHHQDQEASISRFMDMKKTNQPHNSKTRDQEEEASAKQSQPPSSSSSSPSHEFSFTISLHSVSDKNRASPSRHQSSIAVDLSPADDIFFHGHLLPLHFLSHIPSLSPRTSTNSIESFSIPIADTASQEQSFQTEHPKTEPSKPGRSFSLFGLSKWRKGFDAAKVKADKSRFDLTHVIKRYVRMVRPFLSFERRRRRTDFRRQPPYSFSGNLAEFRNSNVDNQELLTRRGRRRGFFSSAPASMRTSPTNSGLLLATSEAPTPTKNSDSTMEELQAAIQAAIAHCKNSIAAEEKLKCQG